MGVKTGAAAVAEGVGVVDEELVVFVEAIAAGYGDAGVVESGCVGEAVVSELAALGSAGGGD